MRMVEGPMIVRGGDEKNRNRGGWNYFVPSADGLAVWMNSVGFEDVRTGSVDANSRIKAIGKRTEHIEMLRAGLSRPDIR